MPSSDQPVFLDRSVIDTITYMSFQNLQIPSDLQKILTQPRYSKLVFLTPPWPEIFKTDKERQKPFEEAVLEYRHLYKSFQQLGFETDILAPAAIDQRADCIEATLETKSALLE
ncbi:AAA family ATPase [Roseibium algae]|uniref:AAA family ATPase n=1 Tax=Roseibium algae TaxID=3123038 RepID=UPI003BF5F29B